MALCAPHVAPLGSALERAALTPPRQHLEGVAPRRGTSAGPRGTGGTGRGEWYALASLLRRGNWATLRAPRTLFPPGAACPRGFLGRLKELNP